MIEIDWQNITDIDNDKNMYINIALYMHVHPSKSDILYLGKCCGTTVRQRYFARDKFALWEYLDNMNIQFHKFYVGLFYMPENERLTKEKIADVESLLIYNLKPIGNIQSKKSRLYRPGMEVKCTGDWHLKRNRFIDN